MHSLKLALFVHYISVKGIHLIMEEHLMNIAFEKKRIRKQQLGSLASAFLLGLRGPFSAATGSNIFDLMHEYET